MNRNLVNNVVSYSIIALLATVALFASANSVQAYYNDYGYYYGYNSGYNMAPYYASQYPYYQPLTLSCAPNTTSTNQGNLVIWYTTASGGAGGYSYVWSGTDGLSSYGYSASKHYDIPGIKSATVQVSSGGQMMTQNCNNSVTVYPSPNTPGNFYPQYQGGSASSNQVTYVNPNSLDIGCFSDPSVINTNQPATWSTEVSGGTAPYTYSWTGSDGLTGSQSSITKYYSTAGEKSAVVTITSADGKTGSRACSNTLTVRSASTPSSSVASAKSNQRNLSESMTAASLFSLNNIPWGLVGILVIIVLSLTIIYLLFNRPKI